MFGIFSKQFYTFDELKKLPADKVEKNLSALSHEKLEKICMQDPKNCLSKYFLRLSDKAKTLNPNDAMEKLGKKDLAKKTIQEYLQGVNTTGSDDTIDTPLADGLNNFDTSDTGPIISGPGPLVGPPPPPPAPAGAQGGPVMPKLGGKRRSIRKVKGGRGSSKKKHAVK